jgi:hypothetical protein
MNNFRAYPRGKPNSRLPYYVLGTVVCAILVLNFSVTCKQTAAPVIPSHVSPSTTSTPSASQRALQIFAITASTTHEDIAAFNDHLPMPHIWTCSYHYKDSINGVPPLLNLKDYKYEFPKATKTAMDSWDNLRVSSEIFKTQSETAIKEPSRLLLFHLTVLQCQKAVESTGTCRTLETGFAHGGSAISILEGHRQAYENALATSKEIGPKKMRRFEHYAVDPFQAKSYDNLGARSVARYMSDHVSHFTDFFHISESAIISLSHFAKEQTCFDFIFIDAGHRFEQNMEELDMAFNLLPVGGIIVMHDLWLGSMKTTKSWIETNLVGVLEILDGGPDMPICLTLLKVSCKTRTWDHFEPFDASGK